MEPEQIKNILAPDFETRQKRIQFFKDISLYLIIGLISIIVMFVVPLLSGCLKGDVGLNFPTTTEGWILYCSINGGTAIGNIALFVLFKEQARINCKGHPNYIKANEILRKNKDKKVFIPRSPAQMNRNEYIKKISFILVFSIGSFMTISSLVISFDLVTFLSCILSTITALIMGWVTMIKNEEYWTSEYLEYVLWLEKETHKDESKAQEEVK